MKEFGYTNIMAVPKVENDGKVVELTVIDRLLSCHDV